MSPGLLLHLSGPMQSWGTRGTWSERDTVNYPTRSGLIGLLAAACGHPRNEPLDRFRALALTIRIDRPGQRMVDFHTVGGGRSRQEGIPTANGNRRQEGAGTLITQRHYLADAAFTVAVTSSAPALLDEVHAALLRPHWAPFLGRRSCPPAGPLLLGQHPDPLQAVFDTVPLHREAPRHDALVPVDFVTDNPALGDGDRVDELPDEPVSFTTYQREHQSRQAHHARRNLPAALCGGTGTDWLTAIAEALAAA